MDGGRWNYDVECGDYGIVGGIPETGVDQNLLS